MFVKYRYVDIDTTFIHLNISKLK